MTDVSNLPATDEQLEDVRQALRARAVFDPGARSIDGQEFVFDVDIADSPPLAAYLELRSDGGRRYLGQVTHAELVSRTGPEIEIAAEGDPADGGPKIVLHPPVRFVSGRGRLLGRLDGQLSPTGPADRFAHAGMALAGADALEEFGRQHHRGGATIELGRHLLAGDAPVRLRAAGFNRHTFLCGQSGSGKTYTLGVILERLLIDTSLPLVVLDPNSDFVHLGKLRPRDEVGLAPDDYDVLQERLAEIAPTVRVFQPDSPTAPMRVLFSDLSPEDQSMVLGLRAGEEPEAYNAARRTIDRLHGRDYTLDDLRRAAAETLADDTRRFALHVQARDLGSWDIWAQPGEPRIVDRIDPATRVAVFDLGSVTRATERSVVAAMVLTRLWSRRRERTPRLIVIDEAHNVCPQNPTDEYQVLAADHAVRIAAEGRKFGLFLLLCTQQPDKIHERVLSQCENLLLMRMNSAADIERLSTSFSFIPPAFLRRATTMRLGQGVAAGRIVPAPVLFQSGTRFTPEGGSDLPTTWATTRGSAS